MELLGGFEQAFSSQKERGQELFAPYARFPVLVSAAISSGAGQFATAGEWSYFALLETIKGYQNEDIEPLVESNAPSGWLYSFSVCFLYGSKCGASGESIADILRDTGFFLPLFCPSDTGYFFYEIALLLCRCIVVDAKLLTNIKQRLRVSHAVFGGQREIPSSLRYHSDIFVFDYFIFFLTFAIKPQ